MLVGNVLFFSTTTNITNNIKVLSLSYFRLRNVLLNMNSKKHYSSFLNLCEIAMAIVIFEIFNFRSLLPTSSWSNHHNFLQTASPWRSGRTDPESQSQGSKRIAPHGIRIVNLLVVVIVALSLRHNKLRAFVGLDGAVLNDDDQRDGRGTPDGSPRRSRQAEHPISDGAKAQLQVGSSLQLLDQVQIQ